MEEVASNRDQVAAMLLLIAALAAVGLFALMQIGERLGWLRPMHGVKHSPPVSDRSVEPHPAHQDESPARTGAGSVRSNAPHSNAVCAQCGRACGGACADENSGSLVLSEAEQQAVAAMVRHKIAVPAAKKLDTIRVGWPDINGRSGDPKSRYARASTIYDSVFAPPPPPPVTPIAQRRVPAGVAFADDE